jgi:hypothetical protein
VQREQDLVEVHRSNGNGHGAHVPWTEAAPKRVAR